MGQQVSLLKNAIKHVKENIFSLRGWLISPVIQYIAKHPIRVIFSVLQVATFVVPSIVFTPLLGALGFASRGVAAG